MVKKQTVLFLNCTIFTSLINGLAQFFMQITAKSSIFQSIKKR
ncbi:putative membrane protein [Shigella flexneri 1235-66]|nr:putative membrane protein [Shigella flexneri 1235-66]